MLTLILALVQSEPWPLVAPTLVAQALGLVTLVAQALGLLAGEEAGEDALGLLCWKKL